MSRETAASDTDIQVQVPDAWDVASARETRPSYRPLPTEVEQITTEWLTAALSSRAPGLVVLDFETTEVRHGFTSLIFLTIKLNDAGKQAGVPDQIVIKGGFTHYSRRYFFGYSMEAQSYRDIWADLGLNVPRTYFIDIDSASEQSIIIMENLNARGVRFTSVYAPLNYEQMRRRVAAIAEVHAKSWDKPELQPGGRWSGVLANGIRLQRLNMEASGLNRSNKPQARDEAYEQSPPFLSPEGWAELWELPQNAMVPMQYRELEWNRQALLYLETLFDRLPSCIVHGDLHLHNQYEDADGTPGFFDMMPRREPGFFELCYAITCDLDPIDRRKWERSLVGHYVETLRQHEVGQDFDLAMYYYALSLHHGYMWFLVNDPVWQSIKFNTANNSRFCAAMADNNTKELLDAAMAGHVPQGAIAAFEAGA
jgi:hypothetical protein